MLARIKGWYEHEINRYGGIKGWLGTVVDKQTRKGRHSQDYIHLFYIDPNNYVGART